MGPLVAAIWLMAASSTVSAHTGALEEVVVVARRPNQAQTREGVDQGVLTGTQIQLRSQERSGDLLLGVPGMASSQHSGSGKATQYYLRGFNLDHGTDFATYVDAMPVNQVNHGHGQGYTDLNFVISELVASIDYRKGPFYGDTGDFSGTGMAKLQIANFLPSNQLSLAFGQLGYQRGFIAHQLEMGDGAWLIAGELQGYDGPWRDFTEDVKKHNVVLKYGTGSPQSGWDVTFMDYGNQWNSVDQIPLRKIQDGSLSRWDWADNTTGGDSERSSISWQGRTHNDAGLGYYSLYGIRSALNLWSNFTYFSQPSGDQIYQQDQRTTIGGEAKWGFAKPWFVGADNRHVLGVQWRQDRIEPLGLFSSRHRQRRDVVRQDRVSTAQVAVYWQGLWHWTDRVSSAFHWRWNAHKMDVQPLQAADIATLTGNKGQRTAALWTAAWQNNWQLASQFNLHWHIGRSYHSNDARGVLTQFDPSNGAQQKPADALTPLDGSELGARWQGDHWSVALVAWFMRVDAEHIFVGDAGTTVGTEYGSRRQGVESLLLWQPTVNWDWSVTFNESRAAFDDPDQGPVPGALSRILSVNGTGQIAKQWRTSFVWQYYGSHYLGEGQYAPSSQKASVNLSYQANASWSWHLTLLNASQSSDYDVIYWYESQWADETEPVADRHIHPLTPRQLRISLRWEH